MYGAGSIGRGFIGPLFSFAGYEVVFVDIDAGLVKLLNSERSYYQKIMADPPYQRKVENVRAIHSAAVESVLSEIVSCDIMAVSVGAAPLALAAPTIARGLLLREKRGGSVLNILLCENMPDAAMRLRGWLSQSFHCGASPPPCGLVETVVGRMVPAAPVDAKRPESLSLAVEEYAFLPIDQDAFLGEIPKLPGLIPVSPFSFYIERKLYLHNMAHSCCAYLGMLFGIETVADAIHDPNIYRIVQAAMVESASMLEKRHGVPFESVFRHAESLLYRFENRALGDVCARGGRDPLRKLQADERFAGALRRCREEGINAAHIACGLAAALRTMTDDPMKARNILVETCALEENLVELVMGLWGALAGEKGHALLFHMIQREKVKAGEGFV